MRKDEVQTTKRMATEQAMSRQNMRKNQNKAGPNCANKAGKRSCTGGIRVKRKQLKT